MSSRWKLGAGLLLLCVGVLVGLHVAGWRADGNAARDDGGMDAPGVIERLAKLENGIALLEQKLAELSKDRHHELGRLNTASEGATGPGPLSAQETAEAERLRDERLAGYRASYLSEPVDASWSSAATTALLSKVASDHILASAPGLPDRWAVECRTSLCEMSFDFTDGAAATDWTEIYLADVGETLGFVWSAEVQMPDGTTRVIMYGEKAGK